MSHGICLKSVAVAIHLQVEEALENMPSLIVLDDLHLTCSSDQGADPGAPPTPGGGALAEWLCDVLDSFHPPGMPVFPGMSNADSVGLRA